MAANVGEIANLRVRFVVRKRFAAIEERIAVAYYAVENIAPVYCIDKAAAAGAGFLEGSVWDHSLYSSGNSNSFYLPQFERHCFLFRRLVDCLFLNMVLL